MIRELLHIPLTQINNAPICHAIWDLTITLKYVFYMVCHKLAIWEDEGGSDKTSLTHRACKCASEDREKNNVKSLSLK